jgi:hypothetical protein
LQPGLILQRHRIRLWLQEMAFYTNNQASTEELEWKFNEMVPPQHFRCHCKTGRWTRVGQFASNQLHLPVVFQ